MPRRDNGTRWNLWYYIIDWALRKIKQAIILYISDEPDFADDTLSASDWRTINYICSFLRYYYDTTIATEGRRATLDIVLPTIDFLIEFFKDEIRKFSNDEFIRISLETRLLKIMIYWNYTEQAPVYIAAIASNPYHKIHYFTDWKLEWQPNMRQALKIF